MKKKKLIILSLITMSTLFSVTTSKANENNLTIKKSTYETDTKHWGYMGDMGPRQWGDIKKEFNMCSEGKQQSPINIIASKDTELKNLDLNYTTGSETIINNGHTVQINIKDGSVLKIDNADYKLKQFHFHVPSENNINGEAYPLEAHFVHATDKGQLAVVAVMFEEGEENLVLAKAWKRLPSLEVGRAVESNLTVDEIQSLIPKNQDYYKFMGSLTTPPCSENVKWHVYKNAMSASKKQINAFFTLFSFPNNRPVQATNDRNIEE